MEKGLLEKTGKPLKEWVAIVRKQKFEKHGEILKFLKTEYDFTHGYANFVAHKARESDAASFDVDDLIETQYSGKENLKPIYDRLIAIVKEFGEHVEIAPKKNSVSLRGAKRQFALIKPVTKTRIDLGLKFDNKPTGERLQDSGPFGTMCTHRVILNNIENVDDELSAWLKEAYEEAL